MMISAAYPTQNEHPQYPQDSNPKGARRTLRTLTQRVNQLMGVTFRGEDEYVVIACSSSITATLALNFQTAFQAERPIQAVVISYGKVTTSGEGYIVIRWRGPAPERFFDQLDERPKDITYYLAFSAGPLDICRAPWDETPHA